MSSDPFAKKPYNDITQLDDENDDKEKTIVYYDEGKTTEILLKTFSNAKKYRIFTQIQKDLQYQWVLMQYEKDTFYYTKEV
jgi:hypothetical protein